MSVLAVAAHLPDAPPSLTAFLGWDPQPVPLLPLLGAVLAAVYGWGVYRLRRHGRDWPWWRTCCFMTGCALLIAVTGLGIEGYGYRLLSVWMFQHLTLSILIPPLWVLGSPGVLLLRSTAHRGLGRLVVLFALAGLRSRLARLALHPAFTIPVFLFSYYGLYLTPLLDVVGATVPGHLGLEVFFLASGLLFIVPVLSTGPLPIRQTNLGRFFDIFVEMPLHVFIGVVMMMATSPMIALFATPPPHWGIDPLADQNIAGALAWSYGEPVALIIVTIFAIRWHRDERRDNAVAERYTAEDDPDLNAYNDYLRALHGQPSTGAALPRKPSRAGSS
ncbi:cytochrome c oxidase assembly protein [Nocardia takedensis]|uniref:cytochrome c oxidase assembly protein n=1 Tax=Nocardia takedensis TaxID=259390 RepID=UPI00059516B5|nr:cytochrome c oxidase assembly protein [Nocardia takedensis]